MDENAYERLQCYTLAHGDPAFIHQHVVDAWCASVWGAFHESRQAVAKLLERHGIVG